MTLSVNEVRLRTPKNVYDVNTNWTLEPMRLPVFLYVFGGALLLLQLV